MRNGSQQTTTQDGFGKYQYIKGLIKQAVRIKFQDSEDTADEIMTEQILSGLYNLLHCKGYRHQDWGSEIRGFGFLLYGILVLLGKPGIINQLPEYLQECASEKILKLAEFFDGIKDDEELFAAMDIEHVNNGADDECYEQIVNYYTYNKEALNENICDSYHLREYAFQKKKFEKMEQFIKSQNL